MSFSVIPNLARNGEDKSPALVVAPTRVNGGKSRFKDEAPDSRGEMISTIRKYSIPFDLFHSAVRELAIRVVKKYGIVGFNSNWSSTDDPQEVFPVGSFLRLLGMEATFKEASDELTSSCQDEVKLLSVVLGKKSI